MQKRYRRLLLYILIIGLSIFFFAQGNIIVGVGFALLYYFLFGFITIAMVVGMFGNNKNVKILIFLTFPYTLLPSEKAYYYWLKSTITVDSKNYKKALEIAEKVKEENLSTDNDRSMFNSFLACVFFDLQDFNKANNYLKKAKEIPHREMLNEQYEKMENDFKDNSL